MTRDQIKSQTCHFSTGHSAPKCQTVDSARLQSTPRSRIPSHQHPATSSPKNFIKLFPTTTFIRLTQKINCTSIHTTSMPKTNKLRLFETAYRTQLSRTECVLCRFQTWWRERVISKFTTGLICGAQSATRSRAFPQQFHGQLDFFIDLHSIAVPACGVAKRVERAVRCCFVYTFYFNILLVRHHQLPSRLL